MNPLISAAALAVVALQVAWGGAYTWYCLGAGEKPSECFPAGAQMSGLTQAGTAATAWLIGFWTRNPALQAPRVARRKSPPAP